jgi:hypothetical protein
VVVPELVVPFDWLFFLWLFVVCFFTGTFGAALGWAMVTADGGNEAGAAAIVPAEERYTASASPAGSARPTSASTTVLRDRMVPR